MGYVMLCLVQREKGGGEGGEKEVLKKGPVALNPQKFTGYLSFGEFRGRKKKKGGWD